MSMDRADLLNADVTVLGDVVRDMDGVAVGRLLRPML
jgi:hypothetical protein